MLNYELLLDDYLELIDTVGYDMVVMVDEIRVRLLNHLSIYYYYKGDAGEDRRLSIYIANIDHEILKDIIDNVNLISDIEYYHANYITLLDAIAKDKMEDDLLITEKLIKEM